MATIASPPASGGFSSNPPSIHRDQRLSVFTAINGAYERHPDNSTHTMGDTITVKTDNQVNYQHGHRGSRPTPPPSRQENAYVEYRNGTSIQQQLPSPTETSVNSMKRKRSVSEDRHLTPSLSHAQRVSPGAVQQDQYDQQSYRQHSIQRMREMQSDGEQEANVDESKLQSGHTSRNSPSTGQHDRYGPSTHSFREPSSSDSERPSHGFAQLGAGPHWPRPMSYPTMYHGDTSQRTAESAPPDSAQDSTPSDQTQGNWNFPSGNSEQGDDMEGNYADTIHSQLGPKRKRNFSNRTKTGCMTCRRRKKKCDEGHPFCQNCSRGGFKCEGYSGRTPWPKHNNTKAPVPLQSKDGLSEHPQDAPYAPGAQPPPMQQTQLPSLMPSGEVQQRPMGPETHEAVRTGYIPSPASANSNTQPTYSWPANGHPPYHGERHGKAEYRDLPPLHNPNRTEPPRDYSGVPPISEISRAPPSATHAAPSVQWSTQSPSDARTPYSAAPSSAAAPPQLDTRMTTHPSVNHEAPHTAPTPLPLGEESEKDKMVRGRLFRFQDPLLQDERSRCREALWRLNNAGNPQFGISEREKLRLLRQVVQPPPPTPDMHVSSPAPRIKPQGSVGPNAHVELPFRCHYGYNISIGEDAYIGENCFILDACSVTIGAKSWIGSNVTILTAMAHTDLQHRQGANSSWQGKGVVIEEDVYIGAGAMIYPGVRLQRGAFVEPGSVVKTDQSQYGYLGYKPVYLSQA